MISPRGSEVDAVVAILTATNESGEPVYDDERAMSKAIVKAVAGELLKRDTFALVPRGVPFGYGPYLSEKDAEKAWEKEIGASFDRGASLVRVFPWAPPEVATQGGSCACKHRVEIHVVKNVRGGKTGRPIECGISTCDCRGYQEAS